MHLFMYVFIQLARWSDASMPSPPVVCFQVSREECAVWDDGANHTMLFEVERSQTRICKRLGSATACEPIPRPRIPFVLFTVSH